MNYFIKCATISVLTAVLFSCGRKSQPVPHYAVSKVFKTDTVTTLNVHINNRLKLNQLLLIAAKLKTDSTQIQNLEVHYLLPGNADITAGDNSYYASARYVKEIEVKPADTLKDSDGNYWRINIFGLSAEKVKTLLSLKPKEIEGKKVLGRFIDDYNHTVIIPFNDPSDKKGDLYVIELDSASKVVSATMPLKKNEDGVEKWLVTQNGDYITLKNNVLSQYAADGLGLPFNSIKSGI
jgi:hypothetical protein